MTTTTMRFSINGEWLTNTVRQIWVEGDMTRAIKIMNDIHGMDDQTRMDVILGKKKLTGDSGKGEGMELEDDNATEIHGMPLLTMEQQLEAKEAKLKEREEVLLAHEQMRDHDTERISSPWGLISVPRCMLEIGYSKANQPRYYLKLKKGETHEQALGRFEAMFPQEVERAKQETRQKMDERMRDDALRVAGINPEALKAAQSVVLDEMTKPIEKPDIDHNLVGLNGWISPEGNFYSCGFMGHVRLAAGLDTTEGELEKKWVKVQDTKDPLAPMARFGSDFVHIPDKGITQAQYDTMWNWSVKHLRLFPKDVKIRD